MSGPPPPPPPPPSGRSIPPPRTGRTLHPPPTGPSLPPPHDASPTIALPGPQPGTVVPEGWWRQLEATGSVRLAEDRMPFRAAFAVAATALFGVGAMFALGAYGAAADGEPIAAVALGLVLLAPFFWSGYFALAAAVPSRSPLWSCQLTATGVTPRKLEEVPWAEIRTAGVVPYYTRHHAAIQTSASYLEGLRARSGLRRRIAAWSNEVSRRGGVLMLPGSDADRTATIILQAKRRFEAGHQLQR